MTHPLIICLTPVKNEAWIIERFLQCASLWADHIILADQLSDDETRTIASRFPKVQIIENTSESFNEPDRQRLLVENARKIPGKKLLISLDADECLSANFFNSDEWQNILQLKEGTCISFDLINLLPGINNCWSQPGFLRGYIDDGAVYSDSEEIHSAKLPYNENSPVFNCKNIKLLHYQYTDWNRMQSKHRWYIAWETLNFPKKNPISLYRMYHHMYAVSKEQLLPLKKSWFQGYEDVGIDMFSVKKEEKYYWDDIVMEYLKEFGATRFSKIAIWEKEWKGYSDPRSNWEKFVHKYLKNTQKMSHQLPIRLIDRFLKMVFQ